MVRLVSNIPIFRRLFYAFLLAAIVPGIMISVLGITFLNAQGARSLAMQASTRMVEDTMNASLALQRNRDLLNVAGQGAGVPLFASDAGAPEYYRQQRKDLCKHPRALSAALPA